MKDPATPKSIFRRWKIYTDEMFPVLIYLPYIIALYFCLNFSAQALVGSDLVFDYYGIAGIVSAFFMMLLMRTFDDLKDFDLDKQIFPHRSTPRKLVLKSDIQLLMLLSTTILIGINLWLAPQTLTVFFVVLIYLFGTFQWFFAEKIHREKVFLTMATHQPIPYMINFYLLHTGMAAGLAYESFGWNQFILVLIFSLPVTSWEVSRKIRSADMETDYETFSMIFGAKKACLIAFSPLLLAGGLSFYMAKVMDLGMSYYPIAALIMLYAFWVYLRFYFKPINKHNILKNGAMIFTTLLFLNLLIHIILQSELTLAL